MRRVLALTLALAAACSVAGPETNIAGTWTLRTIDGQPLPQPFDASSMVVTDVLEIEADGGYRQIQTRVTIGVTSTPNHLEIRGIWILNGSDVTFASVAALSDLSFTAELSGRNQLRRKRQGAEWIYERD